MKAPVPLPFVKRGEEVPPSGVKLQALLGFALPFILILVTAALAYFIIRAGINEPEAAEETTRALLTLLA